MPTCAEKERERERKRGGEGKRAEKVAFARVAGITRPFNGSRLRPAALKERICSPYSRARCRRCSATLTRHTREGKRERERERGSLDAFI